MNTLTINLSDEHLKELKNLSTRLKISPEELLRLGIEEILSRPTESFQDALKYTLDKNKELYQRLAA